MCVYVCIYICVCVGPKILAPIKVGLLRGLVGFIEFFRNCWVEYSNPFT
jgi:hypothetical protein